MSDCTCRPGTEENGWHEKRCDVCQQEEVAVWAEMMKRRMAMPWEGS